MTTTTPVITIHDADLEALAVILGGDVITAQPGAFTLGKQYAHGQVATFQRTIEGVASENLARFERYGSTWRVLELNDEATSALDKVGKEDHPCFQNVVDVIHERFWTEEGLRVADVYKAAQEAGCVRAGEAQLSGQQRWLRSVGGQRLRGPLS